MELHELYRAFDQFNPSPQQEKEMLDRILSPQKEVKPVKKLTKLAAVAAAAAVLLLACAFTFVTGLDQRLMDYFGAGPETVKVLSGITQEVGLSVTDNGSTLEVRQVLMDSYSLVVLADFTAPEGTVLDESAFNTFDDDVGDFRPYFLDGNGERMEELRDCIQQYVWRTLDDGDPLDNHLSLMFYLLYDQDKLEQWEPAGFWLSASGLVSYPSEPDARRTLLCEGDWSCAISLPELAAGWTQELDTPIYQEKLDGVVAETVYISPITLWLELSWPGDAEEPFDEAIYNTWLSLGRARDITLTTKEGKTVALEQIGGWVDLCEKQLLYRLTEVIDPAQLQGGMITFRTDSQSAAIALDGLAPAEG